MPGSAEGARDPAGSTTVSFCVVGGEALATCPIRTRWNLSIGIARTVEMTKTEGSKREEVCWVRPEHIHRLLVKHGDGQGGENGRDIGRQSTKRQGLDWEVCRRENPSQGTEIQECP